MTKPKDATDALLVQKHQKSEAQKKLAEIEGGIDQLRDVRSANLQALDELDAQLDALMNADGIQFDSNDQALEPEIEALLQVDAARIEAAHQIALLEVVDAGRDADWSQYMVSIHRYATQNGVHLSGDPFSRLMTESQRLAIEQRIDDDLTYKNANCDKYDYMLAATCGMVAGLIDVRFVGLPWGQGAIGKGADKAVDSAVAGFAELLGWEGPREGSDPKASAIGFLERKFNVNYDQTHGNAPGTRGTGGKVDHLTPVNHHLKNLAHSPDLVGLVFSIINQFTNTSTFVSNGKLITIDTETFELQGSNFPAKVFAGFCNWLGHLASDVAGSSGSTGRGAGIPIPFYSFPYLGLKPPAFSRSDFISSLLGRRYDAPFAREEAWTTDTAATRSTRLNTTSSG